MATKKGVDGIRAYLDGLGVSDKPVVDREAVKALKAQIRDETDAINKLKLIAQLQEEEQGRTPDRSGDEAVFVAEPGSTDQARWVVGRWRGRRVGDGGFVAR